MIATIAVLLRDIASAVDRHLQLGAHYHNLYLPAFRLLSIDDRHAVDAP